MIDLFSDTLTKPTLGMRKAILEADVGDEQKGEDPTTLKLEQMLAEMTGLSAAMFFPSATMASQVAIMALCERGDELLAAEIAHLFTSECGGPAVHAQVLAKPIPTATGIFSAEDVKKYYRLAASVHNPKSTLLSIENTTNIGGGIAWQQHELAEVIHCAKGLGLKIHMDGARIFNAHIKTGLSLKEICTGVDMVTICLSKGLGCPVGAVLAFDKSYYAKIRRLKQLMGGAMRQSGILAAAGIYALRHHIGRLEEDHKNATLLAERLSDIPQIQLVKNPPDTNMVFFDWRSEKMSADQFNQVCIDHGVRFSRFGANRFRAVTYLDIFREHIEQASDIVRDICVKGK